MDAARRRLGVRRSRGAIEPWHYMYGGAHSLTTCNILRSEVNMHQNNTCRLCLFRTCLGFRVSGFGAGLGFRVQGVGFRVYGLVN